MTRLREHRGSLAASLETTVEFVGHDELVKIIQEALRPYGLSVAPGMVKVEKYGASTGSASELSTGSGQDSAWDYRIGWDTHIVTVDGYGVYGFTDGPVE
jgi:peptidoglycan hydrolase-like protein with peptidoglycan-binding domain